MIAGKNSMSLSEIAKLVRLARKEKQLTQKEAASFCGISFAGYKNVENAVPVSGINNYEKVALAFDLKFHLTIPVII